MLEDKPNHLAPVHPKPVPTFQRIVPVYSAEPENQDFSTEAYEYFP
jgi:hypothetical protein